MTLNRTVASIAGMLLVTSCQCTSNSDCYYRPQIFELCCSL